MASRFFVALAPVAVVAVVAGACSNSALNDHPISDGGLPSTGGAASTTSTTSTATTTSSTAVTSTSSSSSTPASSSSSVGTGGAAATSTGTGGMTSTSAGGAGGAGGSASCTGTDTNCGGNCPQPCGDGLHCNQGTDCASLSCVMGTCVAPTCTDKIQNGTETDVDCGGTNCLPCADGKKCGTAGTNCVDKICAGGTCQVATCSDKVQNGTESDVDCGGSCLPCYPGQKCNTGTDCAEQICSGGLCGCPQGMVVAPIQGMGSYCIDATEVSYGQYQLFYDANPATMDQDAFCKSWNVNWTPSDNWPQPPVNANNPVTNVNWCQAAAYCKYVGHHLCGQIGSVAAVPVSIASFADFHQDQWYNACTADGTNVYPYSSSNYRPAACNGIDSVDGGSPGPQSPSNLQGCLGGETGLLEMSGNVAEWENACDGTTGNSDNCLIRGGSYLDGATKLRCDSGGTPVSQPRDYQGPDVGFRCCF